MMRRSKDASTKGQRRAQIVDGISFGERLADVEDHAISGYWEGDLITGSKYTHIAALVEHQSGFTMLVKVLGKDTASVVSALRKQVIKLPAELRRSLAWHRGMELGQHKRFPVATNTQVYFCDPRSPLAAWHQ
jgi:IS30 family transposase